MDNIKKFVYNGENYDVVNRRSRDFFFDYFYENNYPKIIESIFPNTVYNFNFRKYFHCVVHCNDENVFSEGISIRFKSNKIKEIESHYTYDFDPQLIKIIKK
jgi:hypothetical protein